MIYRHYYYSMAIQYFGNFINVYFPSKYDKSIVIELIFLRNDVTPVLLLIGRPIFSVFFRSSVCI